MERTVEFRVVVGVDGSPASLAALRRAVAVAAARDAVLVPLLAGRPAGRAARRLLDAALRAAVDGWPGGVLVRPAVVPGPAGPALVAAVSGPADLLVLGAPGRPRRPHRHGDRAARYCRAHAPCSVLTVAAPPAEAALTANSAYLQPS
ncbi:universal stress protein [Streptomyces sp. TLI_171]|uniref:universal stress protein n=1 Tax=Streptomyces sp. TLI_171 TaxID=1938859 RepID=UPI000C18548D|nr:universal stress protein [Streptomyces sp. TLI_171]RKE19967.1 universal stress protein family protein [Streptomyces sp. TLI_171]